MHETSKVSYRKILRMDEEIITIEISMENVSPKVDKDAIIRFWDNLYAEIKQDYQNH